MSATYAYAPEGEARTTIYEFANGRKEKWIGGSAAWRNNNPGNVRPAKAHPGQIGEARNFAVFPDQDTGKRAMVAQLKRPLYATKTLEQAISTYAPKSENDTERYIQFVSKRSGIDRKTRLHDLNDDQLMRVVEAMIIHEGTHPGRIEVIASGKTGKYIWRTARDEKVRKDHAERDGKTFDYANPPKGGNPGEDYNCRCWAEPIPETPLKDIFKR